MSNPSLGREVAERAKARKEMSESAAALLGGLPAQPDPAPETPTPNPVSAAPVEYPEFPDAARIEIEDGPPPWEVNLGGPLAPDDARRFVQVPLDWELRWQNPRMLEHYGARFWKPVKTGDPRVKLLAPAMKSPTGQVRRGGDSGDILYWMPKHWADSRRREKARLARERRGTAETKVEEAVQKANRTGYITVDEKAIRHPVGTTGDGRTMER